MLPLRVQGPHSEQQSPNECSSALARIRIPPRPDSGGLGWGSAAHGCNTSPGDAKVRPARRTLALVALVKLPHPSPLHQRRAGVVYGKILDTLRRGQGSLDFCFLSTALQPRTAKSGSQEQMQGRCAGHQLKLGPLLPSHLGRAPGGPRTGLSGSLCIGPSAGTGGRGRSRSLCLPPC